MLTSTRKWQNATSRHQPDILPLSDCQDWLRIFKLIIGNVNSLSTLIRNVSSLLNLNISWLCLPLLFLAWILFGQEFINIVASMASELQLACQLVTLVTKPWNYSDSTALNRVLYILIHLLYMLDWHTASCNHILFG